MHGGERSPLSDDDGYLRLREATMTTQFHKDVFLPRTLENEVLTALVMIDGRFRLTKHAEERVRAKGINLPEKLPYMECEVVEVTKMQNRIFKFLIRFTHDEDNDAVVSMNPDGTLITAWKNSKRDQHRTLNANPYVRG